MLNKIKAFQKDAKLAERDCNSVNEFKQWLQAEQIPVAIKEVDKVYVQLKDVKNKMTKLYHELVGEDATDCSVILDHLTKALENTETMLSRYA